MEYSWRRIGWLYALGLLAAAQLGKMSALALWSSFVPVGFALGAMGSGLIADLLA